MNKKLLTLAVGAALVAAPFVTAQAALAPTIYGHAHVSIDSLDDDTGLANDSNIAESSNSSRLGFKGSQNVSNGMSAFYKFEWQVAMGSNNNLSDRNQYAGLKGSFGALTVGRNDTPMKKLGRSVDLFWSSQAGENRNITAVTGYDARYDNTIMYSTPKVNGLQGHVMYVTDTTSDRQDDNDTDAISLSATYSNGPLFLGAGWEKRNRLSNAAADGALATDINTDALTDLRLTTTFAAADISSDESAFRLVGSYKLNAWKFTGFYEADSDVAYVSGVDRDAWGVGAAYKMGNTTFKGQYYVADDLEHVDLNQTGADIISVGVDHSLSKNTTVYALYAQTDNDQNADYQVNGGGHDDDPINDPGDTTGTANADPSVFSVGMRIKW